LAFRDFSLLRNHFWPFTEVLQEIFESLMRENGLATLNRLLAKAFGIEALKR
jgi:hypothetical protein